MSDTYPFPGRALESILGGNELSAIEVLADLSADELEKLREATERLTFLIDEALNEMSDKGA